MKLRLFFVIGAFLLLSVGCAQKEAGDGYKLVWEDDFNDEALNTSVWTAETSGRGGGNAEMQYYIPEAATIEVHPVTGVTCLVLNAQKANYEGECGQRPATSARLNTQDKMTFTYGKLEVRAHVPNTADGLWPAFWMVGNDLMPNLGCDDSVDRTPLEELERLGRVIWPKCGEIDLLEMGNANGIKNGTQDRYFNGALHWGEAFNDGRYPNFSMSKTADYSLQDGFHLWTLVWTPDSIKMYLDVDEFPDTAPYFKMAIAGDGEPNDVSAYFHKPFYMILNLAVGGFFTGIPAPEKYPTVITEDCEQFQKITALPGDGTPAKMYVDYVRLYQKGDEGETFNLSK